MGSIIQNKHVRVNPPDIYVTHVNDQIGRGVFASRSFKKDELVEICPVITISEHYDRFLDPVNKYIFNWKHLSQSGPLKAFALGYGSLYNHSDSPNLKHFGNLLSKTISFVALCDIESDEQLTINYDNASGTGDPSKNKWFERTGIKKMFIGTGTPRKLVNHIVSGLSNVKKSIQSKQSDGSITSRRVENQRLESVIERPVLNELIRTFSMSNDVVVYDSQRSNILALNESGRRVLELCDGLHTQQEIIDRIACEYDQSSGTVQGYVENLLETLRNQRVVTFEEPPHIVPDTVSPFETFCVGFGSRHFTIQTDLPRVKKWILRRFGNMVYENDSPGRSIGRIDVTRTGDRYHLFGTRLTPSYVKTMSDVIKNLKYEIIRRTIEFHDDLIWFHAGAAADAIGAIIFAGTHGSGKSTMVTRLLDQGWSYLSDDIVPIDIAHRNIVTFPISPFYRDSNGGHLSDEQIDDLKRNDISVDSQHIQRDPINPSHIIFPSYFPGAPTKLTPLSPATALVEISKHCLNLDRDGSAMIAVLRGIVESCTSYTLTYDGGSNGIAEVLTEVRQK